MPGFRVNTLGATADPNPVPYYKYTWEIPDLFGDNSRGPLIYCRDASTPEWDLGKEEVPGASLKYKFAKDITFSDVKVSFYDTQGFANTIRNWRRRVWTPDTGLQPPSQYKRDSHITSLTYDTGGNTAWTLYNSWPQHIKTGDLTYSDSDFKIVEVTVTYDWAEEVETAART